MTENESPYHIWLNGYDEYGRFLHEEIILFPHEIAKTSRNKYAYLGYLLPEDFMPKIGEWFWK